MEYTCCLKSQVIIDGKNVSTAVWKLRNTKRYPNLFKSSILVQLWHYACENSLQLHFIRSFQICLRPG